MCYYTVLHGVTRCFRVLHGVTWCYRVLLAVAWCYTMLHGATIPFLVLIYCAIESTGRALSVCEAVFVIEM